MSELELIEYQPDRSLETIRTLGRLLDDLERVRIMNSNRIGALERSFGESLPHLTEIQSPLTQAEHLAELELVRTWRRHALAPWAKAIHGLGEKSIARLIAEIGDPSIGSTGHWEVSTDGTSSMTNNQRANVPEDEEASDITDAQARDAPKNRIWIIDSYYNRTVSQLWAYSGVGDPARSRIPRDAVQAEILSRGRPRAKKQLYLIATSMLKTGNREIYDAAREHYAERIHSEACPPCHAHVGDPWKPGHQHMAALRKVEKEFLKDLWRQARRLRELEAH